MSDETVVQVSADILVFDKMVYSRPRIKPSNVEFLRMAIRSGVSLPPIVVEKGTNRIVDGVHKWTAWKEEKGSTTQVPVVYREYPNERELWADSVRLNSGRGLQRTKKETQWVILQSKQRGIKLEIISELLSIPSREITRRGLRGMSSFKRHEFSTRVIKNLQGLVKSIKADRYDLSNPAIKSLTEEFMTLMIDLKKGKAA